MDYVQQGLAIGCLLLMGCVNASAGSAGAAFSVTVAVPAAGGITCTTASSNGSGVKVQCSAGIFVTIAQVNSVSSGRSTAGKSVGSVGPLLEDGQTAVRVPRGDSERSDDSVAEAERGWNFTGQLYAADLDASPKSLKTPAQLRQKNREGTLTAVYVSKEAGGAETVEMLVSF